MRFEDEFISDKPCVFDPPVKMLVWDIPTEFAKEHPSRVKKRTIGSYDPDAEYPFIGTTGGAAWKHATPVKEVLYAD